MPAPAYQLLYCTTELFEVTYYCLFVIYCLCEKYYKLTTVEYYMANCVSWVPRLTLLDLQTNWIYEPVLRMELIHM